MILDWRDAERGDRSRIHSFTCTTPPPKDPGRRAKAHPKQWEYAVQKAIHQLHVPIRGADGRLLLGMTEDGAVGALSLWSELQHRLYKTRIIAVAQAFRGQSTSAALPGAVASEALDITIQEMAKDGPGGRVFGLIDRNNRASQRLVSAHGFQLTPNFPVADPNLQAWTARLPGDEMSATR
ncbi:hypothetical protein AB0E69_15055 [Kribbella sp. NPDC026611]|uniref:hypothetical protein n=1 Tax=Kribbella sp. NPDC026611 TaxID=3154911 RepID=UPI0033F2C511